MPPSPSESTHSNILIVGAGIFGTSTAYHLSLTDPTTKTITILDRAPCPSTLAASTDINKIVRADYADAFYTNLGYEAIDAWREWGFLSSPSTSSPSPSSLLPDANVNEEGQKEGSVYHRSGWIMLDEQGSDLASRIRHNFKDGKRGDETQDLSFEEVKNWGDGAVFKNLDTQGFGSAYWNPGAGWADAGDAVLRIMNEATKRGVRYIIGEVEELLLNNLTNNTSNSPGMDGGGGIKGVKTTDGRIFTADKILLATGAWTSALMNGLEDKLRMNEEMRIEGRCKAMGVCVAHFRLGEEERRGYEGMPVLVYGDYGKWRISSTSITTHSLSLPFS